MGLEMHTHLKPNPSSSSLLSLFDVTVVGDGRSIALSGLRVEVGSCHHHCQWHHGVGCIMVVVMVMGGHGCGDRWWW